MNAMCKTLVTVSVTSCLMLGCGGSKTETKGADCLSQQPKDLKRLTVEGVRSRANVVHELWKVICAVGDQRARLFPEIEGTVKVAFSVDFNGEMGRVEVINSTVNSEEFVRLIVRTLEGGEFSFWGQNRDDTQVTYTFEFDRK